MRFLVALALLCGLFAVVPASAQIYQDAQGGCHNPSGQNVPCGASGSFGVSGAEASLAVTPTVQNAAYSASNALGGLQTVQAFRSTLPASGILNNFWLASKGGSTVGVTVYIFDTNPTGSTCTDKTAFALASADVAKLAFAPFVLTPAAPQGATQTIAQQTLSTSVKNQDATTTTNLYVCLVANGSVTPASTTDLVFKIGVAQD